MPRDFNHVILTGQVCSKPTLVSLSNNKRICFFNIVNIERFRTGDGRSGSHENVITIEVFGMKAEQTEREVIEGMRYAVTGYLRVDEFHGVEKTRVRAYNIQAE